MSLRQPICPQFRWKSFFVLPFVQQSEYRIGWRDKLRRKRHFCDTSLSFWGFYYRRSNVRNSFCMALQIQLYSHQKTVVHYEDDHNVWKLLKNVAFEFFLLWNLHQLLSTQNVNIARFARNVECDFFYDFQTLWYDDGSWKTYS